MPRLRAVIATLNQAYPAWRDARLHETSPSSNLSKLSAECLNYIPTHYDPSVPSGVTIPGVYWRNENLERQTFEDQSFDVVIAQDVLEHVFDPASAVREIARTLAPGGVLIATVPMVCGSGPSRRRASRSVDGKIEYLLPPEFHGNPIDSTGSLVTIDWGYDIVDWLNRWGMIETAIHSHFDPQFGILGDLTEVVVARKCADRSTLDETICGDRVQQCNFKSGLSLGL